MLCPFCSDEIQLSVFQESENFLAIYNLSPILPGHSLIIPKNHFISYMDLPWELCSELAIFSQKVTITLQTAFQTKDFNWTIQDGESAGQTVMHLHLHIIPRKYKDLQAPGDWYPKLQNEFYTEIIDSDLRKSLSKEEMHKIVSFLKETAKSIDKGY